MLETALNDYLLVCTFLGFVTTTTVLFMIIVSNLYDLWKWLKKSVKRVLRKLARKLYYALYE